MMLSGLQKFILKICISRQTLRVGRDPFYGYYKRSKDPPKHEDQVNAITKALERLIDRELLVGYGVRTSRKWYIKEVKLTSRGRKVAKELLGKQQTLPLKSSVKKS